ncbi:MAG: hypothetical protein ACRYFU_18380 [Janthinobacterium lividum]
MDVTQILSAIDAEIARLQAAREAIAALDGSSPVPPPRRGRPKATNTTAVELAPRKRKRNLSPEGRKRIQEAMQRRWADRRKGSKDTDGK